MYDEFIVDAKDLPHSSSDIVDCICDVCGKHTSTSFLHYNESIDKHGVYTCHKCSAKYRWENNLEQRRNDYYNRISEICNSYDYTLLTVKNEIKNNHSYIAYVCPKHGKHKMRIYNFLTGKRCPECAKESAHKAYKLSPKEVVKRVEECGGQIINPDDYYNQDKKNLLFVCPECQKIFTSSFRHFVQHGGQVCSDCSNNESLGEKKIRYYLEDKHIDYISQYWFKDCRDIHPLPFDFYLPNYNVAIEFDGQQHYFQSNLFPETLELIQCHDRIKNDYCSNNGIKLIRIPYTKINKVNEILNFELFHTKI